ncbi:hypothetical protein G7054_g3785 [Neopestalotiopsis clavispora]|nr:hypothetical protein G7054_g3785 [Neopestalotiopsis clavispora]
MESILTTTTQILSSDAYYDLGSFQRTITTESLDALAWFNRGLIWAYAFNHEEACRCFIQTILHDSNCAMGYWGFALAAGPNYNKKWAAFDQQDLQRSVPLCHEAAQMALVRSATASSTEIALIQAIQARYPNGNIVSDFTIRNKNYADAMRHVYHSLGRDDLDVATLFADALMNWKPRQMFDKTSGEPIITSPVFEVKAVLETGLRDPNCTSHPGLPHMYIHLMEMSNTPEAALPAADIIRDLIPDAGHMYHMPVHIDVLIGEYQRAVLYNYKATLADDKYFARNGGINRYSFYRLHNYHSLIYAAMLAGKAKICLESVDRMEGTINEEMLRTESPPLADWLEFFLARCCKESTPSRLDYPNRIVDILEVATRMLDGEIEYRRGNYEKAFASLQQAIEFEDALQYTEPWGWMVPARHAFGALSLEQGLLSQAAQAYAEDLGLGQRLTRAHQHPKNVWALHGYHEALVRLGRAEEARVIKAQLDVAQAQADVPLQYSCFCRRGL